MAFPRYVVLGRIRPASGAAPGLADGLRVADGRTAAVDGGGVAVEARTVGATDTAAAVISGGDGVAEGS